jgi:hypothetical protein
MREDGEYSIFGLWSEHSQERPAASARPEQENLNLQPEWVKARQRVELYLDALCVPVGQRPILTDRAMALAWTKTASIDSIMATTMSALHEILDDAGRESRQPGPAGREPSGYPLTHQRAMTPDSRAFPKIERNHMTPNESAFNRGLKTVTHEDPSSGTLPLRFIFPPGLEQYFF